MELKSQDNTEDTKTLPQMPREESHERTLEALDTELVRRLEQERWRFYEPSLMSEKFINAVADPQNFVTLYSAANGIGKSVTGANLLANIIFGGDNPYFQQPLFKNWPFPKRARIVTDPTNIQKNIVPTLQFWFPHQDLHRYSAIKADKHYLSEWRTDTGWEFDIMSYAQAPSEFEGVTLGFAWLDEPPPEAIYKAIVSRMRKGGIIVITATPLAGSAYLYDMFAKGKTTIVVVGPGGEQMMYERKVTYIEADVWSACKDITGTRGHLSRDDIMRMIAEYDEDDRQARIYGKFQHLIGMVFKTFNRRVHVIKPFHVKPEDYVVWEMLDPHPRNPDAVLWVAIDKYGRKFVVDELYAPVADVDELAFRIKQKASQYRIVRRLCDPSAFNTNQHDDTPSLAGRLASKHGLVYEPGTKMRSASDERIKTALQYNEMNGHIIQPPELYVFDSCERTIWEIEHYRWDEWSGRAGDNRDRKEKPVDKDDHMIEDLGRCLIQEPMFREMEQYSHGIAPQEMPGASLDPYD